MASNRKFLLLCAFVVGAVAVPVSRREQCARYCTDEGDFSLRTGNTYTYDYETTTTTAVQSSSQDKTQIQLTAQVDIEVISKCDLSLRLRGVTLKLSDPESPEYLNAIYNARDFARSVEGHILRFSFQNGKVEHVCPTENAPVWITNIQKGVLSAFQTQVLQPDWSTKVSETDVLGKCKAEYQSLGTSWQGTHTIRKLKDLSTCTERENVQTYLEGTAYAPEFQRKSLPLVKGNQECEQVLAQGFLQSSTCREKLVFRPFANGGSSVSTTVVQKLSYAAISQRTFTGNDYRPTKESLLFRHSKPEEHTSTREEETEAALQELCLASKQDISITVPRIFSSFVYKLKKLPLSSIRSFYQKIDRICPTNTKARKFFMDAIPIVATTDSAKFMYDMISRNEVSEAERKFWLTSLSFVNEPTAEIIATFTPLLDGRHEQALLGVSAMMHTFCKSNDCSKVPEVKNAVKKLFSNLGENCFNSNEKKTILTLKALSNVGVMFGKENILESCYMNPQIRMETRLAAIQAFRRVSCDASRDMLMQMYSNYNEDPEIRIASYLAIMTCPSADTVNAVKGVLMGEKINHVGSFIWTHLQALARSKHPQRRNIRDIVSNLYLLNKYNSDARKFSTAREATFYLQSIDSGFHIDNHLVFSTDSYLPRTAMFNLTVDVFGKTCNLFQIDGRIEGFEHVVESFFGSSGYFPQKNIAKMLREKRALSSNKIQDMDDKFQAKSRFQQSPYGSLDVKIFGTTLWYNQFKEPTDGTPDMNLFQIMSKLAEEHEAEYSRSFMFLDTTFTVPMTSGMPLHIAVNGTANVGLKYGGKFDVKSYEHVDIMGHIEPSGAVEIASLLTVDAGNAARSGLRVVGTMHSSTVMDGRVEVKNGEVVRAQLNMPRDRIDIFSVQSKVFLVHGQVEKEQKVDKRGETNLKTCSGASTEKIFGVQLCSELRLPPYKANSALHPVNGPANFNLYIQKTDRMLKSYYFDAEWKLEMKNGALMRYGKLSMNTPNSQVDRDVRMELYLNHAEHTATLRVKTPVKRFGANAKLVNDEALKKILFELTKDEQIYFTLQTELRTIADKNSITYIPSLEVTIPSRRVASVTGSAYMKYGEKYTVQMQIEDLTEKPILAKGNLEISKRQRYDGELTINSFAVDGTVKGYAQLGDSMSSRITAEFKFLEGKVNKINIMGKMRNLSANSLTKYNGLMNIQASLMPEWNTELAFETMSTTGHIENTVSLALGDGVRSKVHTIRLQEILKYEGSLKNNKVDGSLNLVYPEKNLNYGIQINHENTENSLKNLLKVQYDSNQNVMTEVQLNLNPNTPFSFDSDIKLKYPGRDAALSASFSETNPKEYTATMNCQWQEGRQATFRVNYKDKTDSNRVKYEVEGEMNLPLRAPITFSSIVGIRRGQYAGFAEVNMGMDKYRVKVDYAKGNGMNHRASGQIILNNQIYGLEAALQQARSKLSCNVELKMPNRYRITAKLEGRSGDFIKVGSFETLWDADRDTSKRLGINGEIRNHADGYEGKVIMQIRRRTVTGLLSTSMKGALLSSEWSTSNKIEVEWSPSERASAVFSTNVMLDKSKQDINSQLEITTPFDDYKNLTLSLTHMYANQQWESEISTVLPRRNEIILSTSGKYSFFKGGATVETKGKLQTSFAQLRETSFELSHDHRNKEITSKIQLKWAPEKIVALDISGVVQPFIYRGSLKFTSPFRNFEDISAEIVHNHVPDNYRTRCEFQWAPRRKISVNFEGKHALAGRRRICTITLSSSSPFRDFENTAAKITYSNDGSSFNTDAELNWGDRKKITSSFTGSLRNAPYFRNIESKIQLTTPFRNYENFQISTSSETNRNSYKVNIDAQMPHRSTASFNSQGKISSFNDIELNAVAIAHFPKYMQPQRISVDFVHKLQNSKLRSTLDTVYNNNRLAVFLIGSTEFGYDNRKIEFSTTVNTPMYDYEEIKCDFAHTQRGHEYTTTVQGTKNKVSVSLTHKLAVRDMLNFETTLEATSTNYPNAKLSVIQIYNRKQFEHSSYVTWDRNKRINFNAQYLDKSFIKEITLKLTTPFRNIREFEVKLNYEHQNWDHKATLSAVMDRRHKATLSGSIRNYRWENVNTELEVTSSYSGHEFYAASIKYDLTAPQKSIEMAYSWDGINRKAFTFKGYLLPSYSLTTVELEVSTPYRNFNRISFYTKFENSPPEINLNILYVRDSQKISFDGKVMIQSNRIEVDFDLSSPYRQIRNLKFTAKYQNINAGMSGEITTEWNKTNSYQLKGEYKHANNAVEGKLSLITPFEGYRNVAVQSNINYGGSRKSAEVSLTWENDNMVLVNTEYTSRRDGRGINVNIQTSFENYENLQFNIWYKAMSGLYEGEIKTVLSSNQVYEGHGSIKYNGEHLLDAKLNIDFPSTDVKLTSYIDSKNDFKQITSNLQLNGKESNLNILFKQPANRHFELNIEISTPYKNFRHFALESSLRQDGYQNAKTHLKMVTPFEILRTLDTFGEIKIDDSGCQVTFSLSTRRQKIRLEGKISNRQFSPFTAVFELDAPFLSFRKISLNVDINIPRWNNAKMNFTLSSPEFNHKFVTIFMKDEDVLDFQIKVESSALQSENAILTVKSNYGDSNNIQSEAFLQILGNVHYLNGQLNAAGKSTEITAKLESPMLPEGKAEVLATILRRRRSNSKMYEGKLTFTIPSSTHEMNAKYEGKGNQISTTLKIDSSILNPSPIEAEAKYTNSNNRDIEASFTISTADASHNMVGSLKNYENEKYIQLKIECPSVDILNAFSITGTLKHDKFESIDGSLSIAGKGKEMRIATNMKNEGWKNLEAFVILNTPFNALPMLRVDGRFRNDRFQNIDCSFQVETSNNNLHSLGMTSKISRTKGSEEISLMLHLPLRNYRTVQLLANAHYENDFSNADSRITLTLPPRRFSISGQYGINKPRLSGSAEIEIDGKKWVTTGRLERTSENKDVSLSFITPNSDRYNFGAAYGNSENQKFVAGSYVSPSNEKYEFNTSLHLINYKNFEASILLETPFEGYRNVEARINQQIGFSHLFTNVEYMKNGRRGFLKMTHRHTRNTIVGAVQMECPYAKLRNIKLSYSHQKKPRDQECSIELDWNRVKQFKAELIQFEGRSSHVILDVPVLPMTLTADSKILSYGRELNFKTDYNSRVVGFRTSYESDVRQFVHDTSFTWDEKAEKRISYEIKLKETGTGQELWSKVNTPIRSFMLKGNFTNSGRARSGGIDFYWDSSRDLEKHIAVGVEHTDMSTRRQTTHRMQFKLEHPKLSTDFIQTVLISFGPTEFLAKNELIYSRDKNHHLLIELKANDLTRSNRDSHYKGEFNLKHPITRSYISATGEIMNSKMESSLNFKISRMNKRQVQHLQEVKATLSKIMQQIDVSVRSDEVIRNILGKVSNRNGEIDIFIEFKKNEVKELSSFFKLSNRNKSMEFSVINEENTGVHAVASFPKDFASLKWSHSNRGDAITDVNAFVGLEQSKILKSQLNWRPKMWEELRITTGEHLRAFISSVKDAYSTFYDAMSEELSQKSSLMSSYLHQEVTPFTNEISNDIQEMARELKSARVAFNRMYRRNEFYMQDIVRAYRDAKMAVSEIMKDLSLGYEVLCNIIVNYSEELYYSAYYGYLDMTEYLSEKYSKIMERMFASISKMQEFVKQKANIYAEKLEDGLILLKKKVQELSELAIVKLDKLVRAYAPGIINGYYYLKNAADSIRNSINYMYNVIYEYVESNRFYIGLKNYATSVAQTIQAFRDYEYTEAAQEFFIQIYESKLIDNILSHPNVEYMSDLANSALRKSVQMYYNLGVDIVVTSVTESVTNYAKEAFLNAAHELLSDMYQLKGGAKYEFVPKRGYIAFEMNLPAPRHSLIEVFDFQSYPEYQKLMNIKNTLSTEYYEDFCVWDYYYKFLRYFSPGYWLPTFTGHAVIAGNQHFITFDNFAFDYAGKCSYLLARDFVDGNFSVIVNYGNDHMRKSLTVLSEGKKIDIGHDYKITLDDTKAESPLKVGETVVMREGANIRIGNEKKGFYIVCNFVYNYCSVSLSGFYYAKTGGLFGTFNYEPKLDMMTPTRHLANDLESFANSWEVGRGSCRNTVNMATISSNDYRVQEKCKSLFSKSSSEFRSCFKQVHPESYMNMCVRDLSTIHERNFEEAICESAAAYFLQCRLAGVPLKMPSKCVRCEKQDGSMMTEGEALKFSRGDAITVADVVFLIEEKQCNKDRVRYLGKLAQSIEDNYRHKGYRDVRFSVVGFGGDGIHSAPHVHTMDGQISGPLRSLGSALESLVFRNGPINILEALRYAASLNFRPGTTKSFVLVKCSTCKSKEVKAEYSEMLRTLIDGDISLHLLMEQKYEMRIANKKAKARKVIGVDKYLAFTLKDMKDAQLSGDGDLMAQLKLPKDVCIPLAFEVNGSSFDVQFLGDTRRNTNKKFIDVMSRRIVKSSSRSPSDWGMCCECISTVDGVGKSTCQRCVSSEIANMISAETSGINMVPVSRRKKDVPRTRVRKHKERKNKQ